MNRCVVSGRIGEYGVKVSWSAAGKLQTSFTLACESPSRDGQVYTTWIPCVIVGAQAEALAETLAPGSLVLLEGSLAYHKGAAAKGKDPVSKLVVTCFSVEVLAHATPQDTRLPGRLGGAQGDAWGPGPPAPSGTKKGKPRYPKWHAPAESPT